MSAASENNFGRATARARRDPIMTDALHVPALTGKPPQFEPRIPYAAKAKTTWEKKYALIPLPLLDGGSGFMQHGLSTGQNKRMSTAHRLCHDETWMPDDSRCRQRNTSRFIPRLCQATIILVRSLPSLKKR